MVTTVATKINLKDFPRELDKYSHLALNKQREAVVRGLYRSIPDLVRASPVDTGLYAQSWDVAEAKEKASIGNSAPQAAIIEYGARPFTPPIKPLLAWAKRVLKSGSQPPNYDSDVWALARGTQKKIAERGMKPRFILRDALPKIFENIKKELEGAA